MAAAIESALLASRQQPLGCHPCDPGPRTPDPGSVHLFNRHTLREVPRLIDVAAPPNGDVVREQLKRNNHQHRREQRVRLRYLNQEVLGGIEQAADALMSFGGQRDDGAPRALAS